MRPKSSWAAVLALTLIVTSCAPQTSGGSGAPAGASAGQPAAPKKVVASIFSDPAGMYQELTNRVVGSVSGLAELQGLIHAGLSYADDKNAFQPRLAEALPTAENGLWKVLPDGKMETT